MFDHLIGRIQDHLGGPVVLFQFEDPGLRVVLFEIQDVADVRPPPAVDALVDIPHGAQVVFRCGEQLGQQVLDMVGVLIFIDEHVVELVLVLFPDFRYGLEQFHRQQQQVIEIHRIALDQVLLVFGIDLRHLFGVIVLRLPGKGRRVHLSVLGVGNGGQEPRKRIEFFVQVQFFQGFLQHILAVGGIIDGKRSGVSGQCIDIPAEQLVAESVESVQPHILCGRPHQGIHPLTHFLGRLVGEGDGQDVPGLDPFFQEIGDFGGQGLGLAAAGPGQN